MADGPKTEVKALNNKVFDPKKTIEARACPQLSQTTAAAR
jgi:hypothetical protein